MTALCRAASGGTPKDLLAHLRSDPTVEPGIADSVERRIRRGQARTVDEAIEGWATPRATSPGSARRPGDRAPARAWHAQHARSRRAPTARRPPCRAARRATATGTPVVALELRAGAAAAELLAELAAVGELPGCEEPGLDAAVAAIESATVLAWRGATDGRVSIVDPYRVRVARCRFLFCASLQEGEFPARSGDDPLLGEERRRALGIAALRRRDPADEERFLFHACVSRPTERLYLSWRSSDGTAAAGALAVHRRGAGPDRSRAGRGGGQML